MPFVNGFNRVTSILLQYIEVSIGLSGIGMNGRLEEITFFLTAFLRTYNNYLTISKYCILGIWQKG